MVRERTDALDAVGNTMKAVTKGYAIASAGVAALVLFGSYFLELEAALYGESAGLPGNVVEFSLKEPKVIIGMFIGGLLPFIFSALSMDAVGRAAGAVVTKSVPEFAVVGGIPAKVIKYRKQPQVQITTTDVDQLMPKTSKANASS